MNKNIAKLYAIAQKKERIIIGLMSGTSLDGLDIALCKFKGNGKETIVEVLQFETIAYTVEIKAEMRNVIGNKQVDLQRICLINGWLGQLHALMINQCLYKWGIKHPSEIDVIASHGHTLYHAPKRIHLLENFGNATLQMGDGDHIATHTGIITLSDFRQKHVAVGGEGAPLVLYGDYLLYGDEVENRVMLNIGGIANFTFLKAGGSFSTVLCSDIGAGNCLIDAYTRNHFQPLSFDINAELALKGTVNQQLLQALTNHPFFNQSFPRTTGIELFNYQYIQQALSISATHSLAHYDVLATLTMFTITMIVETFKQVIPVQNYTVYTSGGGIHNPLIMHTLAQQLPNIVFKSCADLGINPDAKEAVLFALLANETLGSSFERDIQSAAGYPTVSMGKISFPD